METATISTKGQIVIPKSIRTELNLAAGTRVGIERRGGSIAIIPMVDENTLEVDDVAGCLNYLGPSKSLSAMEQGVAKGARQRGRD